MLRSWSDTIVTSGKDKCRAVDLLCGSRCRWVCLGRCKSRYNCNRCVVLHGKHCSPTTHRMAHNGGCSGDFSVEDIPACCAGLLKSAHNIGQISSEISMVWKYATFCLWQCHYIPLRYQRRPNVLIRCNRHHKSMSENNHRKLSGGEGCITACCGCRVINIRFNGTVRAGGIIEGNSSGTNSEVLCRSRIATQSYKKED